MTALHTPAPWHFRLEAVRTVIYRKGEMGEQALAVGAGSYPDNIANARLIAAAPDLLAALMGVVGILNSAESNASGNIEFDYVGPRVAAARAAIAKAVA